MAPTTLLACVAEVPEWIRVASIVYIAFLSFGVLTLLLGGRFRLLAVFLAGTLAVGGVVFGLIAPAVS